MASLPTSLPLPQSLAIRGPCCPEGTTAAARGREAGDVSTHLASKSDYNMVMCSAQFMFPSRGNKSLHHLRHRLFGPKSRGSTRAELKHRGCAAIILPRLQRCLGCNTDLSPALLRPTVVAPIYILCPSAWETAPQSSPVVTSVTDQLPHMPLGSHLTQPCHTPCWAFLGALTQTCTQPPCPTKDIL